VTTAPEVEVLDIHSPEARRLVQRALSAFRADSAMCAEMVAAARVLERGGAIKDKDTEQRYRCIRCGQPGLRPETLTCAVCASSDRLRAAADARWAKGDAGAVRADQDQGARQQAV
jgi:ribosomal protein L37E